MAYDDWNPDDFLDFDYENKGSRKKSRDTYDTARVRPEHSPEEKAALQRAQQEADKRYRSNYDKNARRRAGSRKAAAPTVWITRLYLIALAVFAVSMAVMDVIPVVWLIIMIAILVLISVLLLLRMRYGGRKKSTKPLATLACLLLMTIYVIGTGYAMGTLSFLNSTTVKNTNSVARITKEPFNVVITGMDVDGEITEEGRSDVNMVLTVNPGSTQLLMTSIPRDYQINMPDKDYATDKLTHTGFYGVQTTILAEEDLLDFKANYYIKVNFTTVQKFIDAVGGVDVYSDVEFTPSTNAWPDDGEDHPELEGWTVTEGINHMNGAQALTFARERKAFVDGDRQRVKNQQAVLEAVIKKATSSSTMLLNYTNVLSDLRDYVEMSLSSREVRSLVKFQVSKSPHWSIYRNSLTGGDDTLPLYTSGGEYAYVMTRDEESIAHAKELIQAVMKGEPLTKDENGVVNVLNSEASGEGEEGADGDAAGDGDGETGGE